MIQIEGTTKGFADFGSAEAIEKWIEDAKARKMPKFLEFLTTGEVAEEDVEDLVGELIDSEAYDVVADKFTGIEGDIQMVGSADSDEEDDG